MRLVQRFTRHKIGSAAQKVLHGFVAELLGAVGGGFDLAAQLKSGGLAGRIIQRVHLIGVYRTKIYRAAAILPHNGQFANFIFVKIHAEIRHIVARGGLSGDGTVNPLSSGAEAFCCEHAVSKKAAAAHKAAPVFLYIFISSLSNLTYP